jgi:phenylacetate-CoA ligase
MRTLPLLRSVDGRLDDVVITREGRQIGRLDPVFKGQLPIREAQIIQESLDLIRVKVVPASGFNAESSAQIKRRLLDRIGGGVEIVVDPVGHIERTSSGKFRSVISLVKRSNAELSQGSVVRSMGSA